MPTLQPLSDLDRQFRECLARWKRGVGQGLDLYYLGQMIELHEATPTRGARVSRTGVGRRP